MFPPNRTQDEVQHCIEASEDRADAFEALQNRLRECIGSANGEDEVEVRTRPAPRA